MASDDRPAEVPAPGGNGDDWVTQAVDAIDRVVGAVRDKTAVPLDSVARSIVYGLLAGIVGSAAAVLLAIGGVRALDVAVPGDVWRAHAILGGIFFLVGLFLWSKRSAKA